MSENRSFFAQFPASLAARRGGILLLIAIKGKPMKNVVSVALILSLTVPGFAQSSTPGCTPPPGQSVCSAPGAKNIWRGTSTYAVIGVAAGIAGAIVINHHYHHKAQAELKR